MAERKAPEPGEHPQIAANRAQDAWYEKNVQHVEALRNTPHPAVVTEAALEAGKEPPALPAGPAEKPVAAPVMPGAGDTKATKD